MKVKGNGRKKKKRNALCLLIVVLAIGLYCLADYAFKENKKVRYADKIKFYERCMEKEKAWIVRQQNPQGAICLYESEKDTQGVVNPYFACLAARGVLTGNALEWELKSIESYLKWHTEELIQTQGVVCDYQVEAGELIATGAYDSVDAYLAVYLSLIAEYAKKGGELQSIPGLEEAVEICAKALQNLTWNGLTQVSEGNHTYYLMDNVEVLEAYRKMSQLLSACEAVKGWKKRQELLVYFTQAALETEEAMKKFLWSENEHRFEVGLNGDFTHITFQGMEQFYPEAIVQLYPAAFDIWLTQRAAIERLYQEITSIHLWNDTSVKNGLASPILAYTAVQLGDILGAEGYIKEYYNTYDEDRSYPLNTADAGWLARCCESLRDYYLELTERGLWEEIVKEIKEKHQ